MSRLVQNRDAEASVRIDVGMPDWPGELEVCETGLALARDSVRASTSVLPGGLYG